MAWLLGEILFREKSMFKSREHDSFSENKSQSGSIGAVVLIKSAEEESRDHFSGREGQM